MRKIIIDPVWNCLKNFSEALDVPVELIPPEAWEENKYDGFVVGRRGKEAIRILDKSDRSEILAHELAHLFLPLEGMSNRDERLEQAATAAGELLLNYVRYTVMRKLVP